MAEEPRIGVFDYNGTPVEAWVTGRRWHVRFNGREVERRTVGEALEEVLGESHLHTERRQRDSLILTILMWSRDDELH